MFKWLFHILIFATSSGKYQNKEKPLKRKRKLGLAVFMLPHAKGLGGHIVFGMESISVGGVAFCLRSHLWSFTQILTKLTQTLI